ncbi:hypothetical protein D3C75_1201050 [compost metagenome]
MAECRATMAFPSCINIKGVQHGEKKIGLGTGRDWHRDYHFIRSVDWVPLRGCTDPNVGRNI